MENCQIDLVKSVQVDILLAVDGVCCKLGISYFLDSGTALGAARHQGFIPWDDDIDIGMLRSDYERFLEKAQELLGEDYFVQTRDTDPDAPFPFAKVRKSGTVMKEKQHERRDMHHGVWIDVFPYDAMKGNRLNLIRKRVKKKFLFRLYSLRLGSKPGVREYSFREKVKSLVRKVVFWLPEDFCSCRLNALGDRLSSQDVGLYTCFLYPVNFPLLSYEDIFPLKTLEFEGHKLPVMRAWDKYLKQMYGDWKRLPPLNERVSHEVADLEL